MSLQAFSARLREGTHGLDIFRIWVENFLFIWREMIQSNVKSMHEGLYTGWRSHPLSTKSKSDERVHHEWFKHSPSLFPMIISLSIALSVFFSDFVAEIWSFIKVRGQYTQTQGPSHPTCPHKPMLRLAYHPVHCGAKFSHPIILFNKVSNPW